MLIRLRGCTGWSAPLLFANTEDRFSHIEAHIQLSFSAKIHDKSCRKGICQDVHQFICVSASGLTKSILHAMGTENNIVFASHYVFYLNFWTYRLEQRV